MSARSSVDVDGISFEEEPFDQWLTDAKGLIESHLMVVGESPDNWRNKNLELMKQLSDAGVMQIVTARSNGRMFGYLMSVTGPSMTKPGLVSAANGAVRC